jgi:hypothetical protein
MSQQGALMRFDKATGERRDIRPVHPDAEELRFNWNAAFNVDPHDSTTVYLGSQFVHRSRDGGLSWEIISPDLTTDDPEKQRQDLSGGLTLDATGAENHTTILSIAPSPLEQGLIWVTTDDGNVQITRDGGVSWENVRTAIRNVPSGTWAPHVEPSKHDPATAYVVFEDHRRGDWTSYVLRTRDYGESWEQLSPDGIRGFVHVLEEDPVEPRLLFLGTEFGLHLSLDGGEHWIEWRHGIPAVPVRALIVHPRDHDLVAGTHGRAAYILDDIRPLRALSRDPDLASRDLYLFEPPPALQVTIAERIGYRSTGHAMFFGENRVQGALLSAWVGEGLGGSTAEVQIVDQDGNEIRTFMEPLQEGMNRFSWDLRRSAPVQDGGSFRGRGALAMPGEYIVRIRVDDAVSESALSVLPDPRTEISRARRQAKVDALEEAGMWFNLSREAQDRVEVALRSVEEVLGTLPDDQANSALREAGSTLRDRLSQTLEDLFTGPRCQGICGGNPVADPIRTPLSKLGSSADAPSPTDLLAMEQARTALLQVVDAVNGLFEGEVAEFRRRLQDAGFTPFPVKDPLRIGGTR